MAGETANEVIYKQPGETLNVEMKFSTMGILGSAVTLSSPSVSVVPSGELTVSNEQVSGQSVLMTLTGGTNNKRYRVEVTVTTSDSQTLEGDGIVHVRDA